MHHPNRLAAFDPPLFRPSLRDSSLRSGTGKLSPSLRGTAPRSYERSECKWGGGSAPTPSHAQPQP